MRRFNLKAGYLIENPYSRDPNPGRTIYPEPMHMAEPGWAEPNYDVSETVQRREGDIEDEELAAAREWLNHVEAGRLG